MNKFDTSSIDAKLLKLFIAIFETGSVTKAAAATGCSQSAASHGLDRLRNCIGDPLFVKCGRGIRPTSTAISIAPNIVDIVSKIESLALQGAYHPHEDKGPFTIATNVTELLPVLIEISQTLRSLTGDVHLRFLELGSRENALAVLSEGKADFAITASIGPYPLELFAQRLCADEFVCFYDASQRSAPTTEKSYIEAGHAILDYGGNTKSIVDATLDNIGATRRLALSTSNSFALSKFAFGTDFLITLPKSIHTTAFTKFAYCTPPIPFPGVKYDLLMHRRATKSSRHQWFAEIMLEAAAGFEQEAA